MSTSVRFHGRLDNRDELVRVLDADRSCDDAAIAAAAYRRWETAAPERMIGSFALVVRDGERTFCATDHLATRPLFYREGPAGLEAATSLGALLTDQDELDHGYLLASLCLPTGAPLQSRRTAYRGVRRLPGGTALLAEPGRPVRTWRYWRPEDLPEATGTLEELGEELRARLDLAVRAQARTAGRVLCTLSGGLDSSSITGLLARSAVDFDAVSLVFGDGVEADEQAYRRAAEARYGIAAVEADARDCWHFRDLDPSGLDEPFMSFASYAECRRVAEVARRNGCDVLLYGHGGDELWSGSEHFIADLLARGRWIRAWRRGRELAGLPNRTYAHTMLDLGIGPLLASRRGIAWDVPNKRWDSYWYRPTAPPWISADRALREDVDEIWHELSTHDVRPIARGHEMTWMRSAVGAPALNRAVFAAMGVEMRTPFYDRRVVELALSIPGERKLRVVDGTRETKLVLREAMRDILPAEILRRRGKASMSVASANGLQREWSRIWNGGRFELAERGLVNGSLLGNAMRAARMGQWDNIAHLTALVVIELWLRTGSRGRRPEREEVTEHGAQGDVRDPAARPAG